MTVELKVPEIGESIAEVQVAKWLKAPGERAERDEKVVVIETDKATVEVPAPVDGVLAEVRVGEGQMARVGDVLGVMEEGSAKGRGERDGTGASSTGAPTQRDAGSKASADVSVHAGGAAASAAVVGPQAPAPAPGPGAAMRVRPGKTVPPSVRRAIAEGRMRADDAAASAPTDGAAQVERADEVVPMTLLRRRVAERLVQAQQNAALLTTFNEVDMSAVMDLRKRHREAFQEKHGVKLGFMSFFVRAAVEALIDIPQVNAEIRDDKIVLHRYCDIGVAVGGGRGLVVPVLRNAETLTFAEIERAIADFGRRAQENRLKVEELQGGTFTISNGGVYGSLLSTPIVNPPQSGILGLHAIQDRPVARDGQVVIRPMMYLALTYDHRLVDGREAVTFLKRIKDCVEDPARLLLEV